MTVNACVHMVFTSFVRGVEMAEYLRSDTLQLALDTLKSGSFSLLADGTDFYPPRHRHSPDARAGSAAPAARGDPDQGAGQ